VLVAHFLGVDHAGHTFSMDSEPMAAKLAEMDQVRGWRQGHCGGIPSCVDPHPIRAQVISATASHLASHQAYNGTLFLVLGDHGMTWQGDHGGATAEEVDSALFAMAPQPPASPGGQDTLPLQEAASMPQVDFAPTLALLLGVPIPFGNVGRVAAGLWALAGVSEAQYAAALGENTRQVHRAMQAYGAAGAFSAAEVRRLEGLFNASRRSTQAADAFLEAAAQVARAQWTQFDVPYMVAGVAVMCAALCAHLAALATSCSTTTSTRFRLTAVTAAGLVVSHACGDFSVAFMKEEHRMGHLLMIGLSTLITASAAASRRSAVRPACLMLGCSLAMWALSMTGEDKPVTSAPCAAGWLTGACMLSAARAACMVHLPMALLPLCVLHWGHSAWSGRASALSGLGGAAVALRWLLPAQSTWALIILPRIVYALTAVNVALACVGRSRAEPSQRLIVASRHMLAALTPLLLMLTGKPAVAIAALLLVQTGATLAAVTDGAEASQGGGSDAAPAEATSSDQAAEHFWRDVLAATALHATCRQLFSASGHRSTFDALHFTAAFTGFPRFHFVRQGALLALNTWSSELVAAPLLLLYAAALTRCERRGDGSHTVWRSLRTLALTRGALSALDATCAIVSAAVLRRHLHVWSHFAPKFVFQTLSLLVTDALLLLTLAWAAYLTSPSWRQPAIKTRTA
jgi:phosphatidylinositol glycan class O